MKSPALNRRQVAAAMALAPLAARLPALIGASVVVENRTGAGGNVGSAHVCSGLAQPSGWP
jgi:tripartite-type tricarboxylate transporter receptor subunit TctC